MTRKSLARTLGVSVALQLLSSGVGEQDADAVARAAVAGARMLAAALPGHAEAVVAADVDEAALTAFRAAFRAQVRRIECCADAPVLDEVITSAGRASVLGGRQCHPRRSSRRAVGPFGPRHPISAASTPV